MKHLLNSRLMKDADQFTIRQKGIPSMELMERAARACVTFLTAQKEEGILLLSNVCVFCGTGNNGGDGFAIARMLLEEGSHVTAVLVGEYFRCTSETAYQMEQFKACGGTIQDSCDRSETDVLIDAVFGIGLSRSIKGIYATAIAQMNEIKGYKLSVDIPSGISADSGCVMGIAFEADATVTFQEMKVGMVFYPGQTYAGMVVVVPIGIDTTEQIESLEAICQLDSQDYTALLPRRYEDSNKGTYGKVLLIAGSHGMSGAAYLSAKAAYVSGAGLVQIYTAEDNRVILQTLLPEAIVKTYTSFDKDEAMELISWADVVCIGSGIGQSDTAKKLLKTMLSSANIPCVIDADGLNLLASHPHYLEKMTKGCFLLTPHMKEMERLTAHLVADLRQQRVPILQAFVERYSLTCVLKDSRTLIASPDAQTCINTSGNSAMAKAGAGDVLAGIITGFLAQGMSLRDAGMLGVYVHGRAGDLARKHIGSYGVMATDLMLYLTTVMKEM